MQSHTFYLCTWKYGAHHGSFKATGYACEWGCVCVISRWSDVYTVCAIAFVVCVVIFVAFTWLHPIALYVLVNQKCHMCECIQYL